MEHGSTIHGRWCQFCGCSRHLEGRLQSLNDNVKTAFRFNPHRHYLEHSLLPDVRLIAYSILRKLHTAQIHCDLKQCHYGVLRPGGINLAFLNSAIDFGKIRKITTGIQLKRDCVSPIADLEVAEKKQVPAYAIFSIFLQLLLFTVQKNNSTASTALPQGERPIWDKVHRKNYGLPYCTEMNCSQQSSKLVSF